MITDSVPKRAARKEEYLRSDRLCAIELPPAEPLRVHAGRLEEALARESRIEAERACNALSVSIATAFGVAVPPVKVLGVRPHRVLDGVCIYQMYGDYHPETMRIRIWLKTAIRQKVSSFGTLLSTLCHELCHHLDMVSFDFPNTFHTRGFFERSAVLYHHIRGTPLRKIVWNKQANGRFRVNWGHTMGKRARDRVL